MRVIRKDGVGDQDIKLCEVVMRQNAKGLNGQESQFKVILCAVGSHGQAFKMGKEIIRFHFCKALSCGGVAKGLQEPKIKWGGEGIDKVKTNKNLKNECNSDIKRGAEKTKALLFYLKDKPDLKQTLKNAQTLCA